MAIYAIGDLQGCYDSFRQLLDKLKFNADKDRLWLCGDLINRGPKSLKTLRFVVANQSCIQSVLGNHDLHLLNQALPKTKRISADFEKILKAPDRDELLHWLRSQPLMHYDREYDSALVHAGLLPGWSIKKGLKRSREVERVLQGKQSHKFLREMYGDKPALWSGKLSGNDRLRFIVNAFTRMRMVDPTGALNLTHSGPPSKADKSLQPWFSSRNRKARKSRIVFGHWSALGLMNKKNLVCLDTGCVWGRQMTALRIDKPAQPVQVNCIDYES